MTHLSRPARSFGLKWLLLLLVAAIVAGVIWRLLAAGHGPGEGMPSGRPGAHGMMGGGAMLVHSGVASTADVPVWLNALGTVIPNASVTVTSRVDGQLEQVFFTEGQKVSAGQLLAQINPRSFQATLNQYQGELSENQALLKSAELTLARYRKLAAQDALARQDLHSQIATVGSIAVPSPPIRRRSPVRNSALNMPDRRRSAGASACVRSIPATWFRVPAAPAW